VWSDSAWAEGFDGFGAESVAGDSPPPSAPSADSEVYGPFDWLEQQRIAEDRAFYALAAVAHQHDGTEGQADDLKPFYESPLDPDEDLR
jgi:hypothetical protein